MNDRRKLRLLIADDEGAITRIYSIGLQHYFAPDDDSGTSDLDNEFFGDAGDDRPTADITVCQQGDEAVELTREAVKAGTPFDVVVLDIRMPPGISGVDAAKQIRTLDETVPILFVSGYSDFAVDDLQGLVPPVAKMDLIEKPVQLAKLASKIKRLAG